ncbi:MAG: response regulator transcription factor [Chloroflexi bacterium]|nr:response regulator transcription factor [Chloroflexota bacterium]
MASQPEIKRAVTAKNYPEAEAYAAELRPDIIWLDMDTTGGDTISEISQILKLSPASRIMTLTNVEDDHEAFAVIMAGATGYRSKQDVDLDEIMAINRMLCRGELVLRPSLLTRLVQRLRSAAMPLWGSERKLAARTQHSNTGSTKLAQLTERESEILQFISKGYRDRDIAEGLHISEKTVQKHVQSILNKLNVQNRTEAAYLIHHRHLPE